jgi:hypothetical protein
MLVVTASALIDGHRVRARGLQEIAGDLHDLFATS